jgi:hypothetical protein
VPKSTDSRHLPVGDVEVHNGSIDAEHIPRSALSPLQSSTFSLSPGAAPFEWYQLLAHDALNNIEEHSLLVNEPSWNFDPTTLLQTPNYSYGSPPDSANHLKPSNLTPSLGAFGFQSSKETKDGDTSCEPWNTKDPLILQPDEVILFKHFTKSVGPILDLFDPSNHFSETVPHLALRNIGLMKSMLAVSARHLSLTEGSQNPGAATNGTPSSFTDGPGAENHLAVQYYYETLRYLSQAMQYPSYTRSLEILATAIMISTYEMFADDSSDWERHLRGAFWIQRTQDNDGESNGLQKAVWWAWLRQDIWAAFRHKRRTMTIWRPTKPLSSLGPDEMANRSTYLVAKAIEYISNDQKPGHNVTKRIEDGQMHLKSLEDWFASLPASFKPIELADVAESIFQPLWIHPPRYSASVQMYCFAKIVILISMPSMGGMSEYNEREKALEEAVNIICGLAQAPEDVQPARAFVNVQCLFVGKSILLNLSYIINSRDFNISHSRSMHPSS